MYFTGEKKYIIKNMLIFQQQQKNERKVKKFGYGRILRVKRNQEIELSILKG